MASDTEPQHAAIALMEENEEPSSEKDQKKLRTKSIKEKLLHGRLYRWLRCAYHYNYLSNSLSRFGIYRYTKIQSKLQTYQRSILPRTYMAFYITKLDGTIMQRTDETLDGKHSLSWTLFHYCWSVVVYDLEKNFPSLQWPSVIELYCHNAHSKFHWQVT